MLHLKRFSALSSQYLLVQFVDGSSQIMPGPTHLHMDQSVHKDVKVQDAINLTENEVLVVYRDDHARASLADTQPNSDTSSAHCVTRHVIHGPCLHVPKNATE